MMWGPGYEATWWMLLTMISSSVVGIIVMGALVWIVVWSISHWRQNRQCPLPQNEDEDQSAIGTRAIASTDRGSSASVITEETAGQDRPHRVSNELTLSRR